MADDPTALESSHHADDDRILLELLRIREGDCERRSEWIILKRLLSSTLQRQSHNSTKLLSNCSTIDESKLRSEFIATILHLLGEQRLLSAWAAVIKCFLCTSTVGAHKAAQEIATEHRIVSNFFGNSHDFPMSTKEYSHCIIMSLINCFYNLHENQSVDDARALSTIITNLPSDFLASFIDCICLEPSTGSVIISYLPSDFALNAAYLLLRRLHSGYKWNSKLEANWNKINSNEMDVFQKLVECALIDCYPITVIEALFLQKPFTSNTAELIVNILPESCYIDLLDSVGSLWGEKLFVSKGDERVQEYLTIAMISTLKKVTGELLLRYCYF